MIRGVLLDLAGVIYEGEKALPGALDAVARLQRAGLPLRFATNTTRATKLTVLQRLARLGLHITEGELFTPAQAATGMVGCKRLLSLASRSSRFGAGIRG